MYFSALFKYNPIDFINRYHTVFIRYNNNKANTKAWFIARKELKMELWAAEEYANLGTWNM